MPYLDVIKKCSEAVVQVVEHSNWYSTGLKSRPVSDDLFLLSPSYIQGSVSQFCCGVDKLVHFTR